MWQSGGKNELYKLSQGKQCTSILGAFHSQEIFYVGYIMEDIQSMHFFWGGGGEAKAEGERES